MSGSEQAGNFKEWKKKIRSEAIQPLAIHTSSVIAKPIEVLKRYGILDLLSSGRTVQMKEIIKHVRQLKIDGEKIKFNTPNTQYIFAVLRALSSLGWITAEGESASEEMAFTLTPKGIEAIQYADRYAEVADFMPEFSRISNYLFNRLDAPVLKNGALTLGQLDARSKQGWGISKALDAPLAELIKGQLDGYLVINLALALWKEGVFDHIDVDLEINMHHIIREKGITGNTDELKAAFDIFVNVGFLSYLGEGRYKLTQQGLVAFDRVLAYGVTVSYRPSYDLSEQFMFGDPKAIKREDADGNELLVDRDLNVLGSGASHTTYFKQVDKIVQSMIKERLENNEIPDVDQLSKDKPFVLSFADTGSGDGKYLAHVYHVIMAQTRYGDLVREHPELYKIEMVGVDYNIKAMRQTKLRLLDEGIDHLVMFGNINDPQQIVRDVKLGLLNKYGTHAKTMVIHTRTFLDHNRPWKDVENIDQAKHRVSTSTGTYGWRGKAISNNFVEQNLYDHFNAWQEALLKEGQKDLIVIELHTIPPQVAAARIGKTLDVPYWLSHAFSDQFIIEYPIYKARVEEAGFVGASHKLYPDGEATTVSIDHWKIAPKSAAMGVNRLLAAQESLSPFGGINLNPDLGFVGVERDANAAQLAFDVKAMQSINIEGIQPILLKLSPLSAQNLSDD